MDGDRESFADIVAAGKFRHERPSFSSPSVAPERHGRLLLSRLAGPSGFRPLRKINRSSEIVRPLPRSSPGPGEQAPLASGVPREKQGRKGEETVTEEIKARQTAEKATSVVVSGQAGRDKQRVP